MKDSASRMKIDDESAAEVAGGLLSLKKHGDGNYYVEVRDGNFQVVEEYQVLHGVRTVNSLMQEMYWSFAEGSRDNQMIKYLHENGYI